MSDTDLLKNFQQADALYKMFNANSEQDSEGQKEQFEKMMQMLEMFQLFQNLNAPPEPVCEPPISQQAPETPESIKRQVNKRSNNFYDDEIVTPELKIMKAAIPYLPYPHQKQAGLFVKMVEMRRLVEMYSSKVIQEQAESGNDWRKGMLIAIRPHMSEEKRDMIDMLMKCIELKELTVKLNEMKGADSEYR